MIRASPSATGVILFQNQPSADSEPLLQQGSLVDALSSFIVSAGNRTRFAYFRTYHMVWQADH